MKLAALGYCRGKLQKLVPANSFFSATESHVIPYIKGFSRSIQYVPVWVQLLHSPFS